jgi:hypothetical protein
MKVSLNAENASIMEVLMDLSRQTNLKFRQVDNVINVSKKAG